MRPALPLTFHVITYDTTLTEITVQGSFRATLTGSPFVPARASAWGAVKATYRSRGL